MAKPQDDGADRSGAEVCRVIRMRTIVQAGGRVEVTAAELAPGSEVEVLVVEQPAAVTPAGSLLAFLDSLPAGPRSAASWEELERLLEEERASWDR